MLLAMTVNVILRSEVHPCHPEERSDVRICKRKQKRKRKMKENFEYAKAVEELEAIAAKVEDPDTSIDDIDRYMKRSKELLESCRAYLRGRRESLEGGE